MIDQRALTTVLDPLTFGEASEGDQVLVSREQLRQLMALFAQAAVGASGPRLLSDSDKQHHYRVAFAEWLANNPKTGRPRPPATVAAYTAAWTDFRRCCPADPWRISSADIKAWLSDMRERPLNPAVAKGLVHAGRRRGTETGGPIGLSDGTQAQYLAAVSSFYTFCANYPIRLPDGTDVKLFDGVNPVKAQGVPKPAPRPFAEANYLSPEQLRALLNTIGLWAKSSPSRNLQGLRDYSLFTCYVMTGGRSSEIRLLRWQDLRQQGGRTYYHWTNKGKTGWDELPPPAWEALDRYLQLANRRLTIQPGDYIFTPLGDSALRFGNIAEWDANRPLSGHEVGRLLKKYAALAGFEARLQHVHTLRHSAYMLYTEGGVDVRFCSKLLHHSNLATTSHYDHVMAGQRNTEWAKAWTLLDLDLFTFESFDGIAPAATCESTAEVAP